MENNNNNNNNIENNDEDVLNGILVVENNLNGNLIGITGGEGEDNNMEGIPHEIKGFFYSDEKIDAILCVCDGGKIMKQISKECRDSYYRSCRRRDFYSENGVLYQRIEVGYTEEQKKAVEGDDIKMNEIIIKQVPRASEYIKVWNEAHINGGELGTHAGIDKTRLKLGRKYVLQNIIGFVKFMNAKCHQCYNKNILRRNIKPKAPLFLRPLPEKALENWAIDSAVPFTSDKYGNNYFTVARDELSGYIIGFANKGTADEVGLFVVQKLYYKFGDYVK